MWRERGKSAILVLLVAVSVYLSLLLGMDLPPQPGVTTRPAGGAYWGSGRSLLALLAPARLVLYSSQGAPAVLYPGSSEFNRAWEQALDVLQQLGIEKLQGGAASGKEWEAAAKGGALELVFALPLGGEVWGPVLEYPSALDLPWPVKRMLLAPGKEPKLFVAAATGEILEFNLQPAGAGLATAFAVLDAYPGPSYRELHEPLPVSAKVYVPDGPLSVPVLRVSGEVVDADIVAGSFFADLSLTRRIKERDGATIYSDGRRGVRIRADSSLEYNAPEVASGVKLPAAQALERAVRFVTQHGGWPPEVRLMRLEEVVTDREKISYRISFSQFWNGFPLEFPTLHVELSDRGVAKYERSVLYSVGRAGWVNVNSKGLEERILNAGKLRPGEQVADVYLAYRHVSSPEGDALLVPVWAVETAASRIFWLEAVGGDDA